MLTLISLRSTLLDEWIYSGTRQTWEISLLQPVQEGRPGGEAQR